MNDREGKQERLARVRSAAGEPLVLTSHEAVSWYLDGVRTHVSLAGPPVLAVRVEDAGDTLFVAANEADRLIAEELLPADADRVVRVDWQMPPADAALAAGSSVPESAVAAELRAARASLLPGERDRYRALGHDAAAVLTDVLSSVTPSDSEQTVAASVAQGLVARGIDPLVILVSGASRLAFRHPLPTSAHLGERAMVVVCGRRHGLIANITRWVGADAEDERILGVERAFLDASVPGRPLDVAFAEGAAAYAANGFAADEWQRHHQGGPTGYAGRDPRATSVTTDALAEWQAFAWNPTAPGVKVEDTLLRTPDGWEVLTLDERWPTVAFGGLSRPVALPFA
ncbi:peptidase M24 [Microbacterium sp. M28]|uniref:M24 family metallopeptidase n=1 Tax=Microbacterium sp. M28 TaxID=2962064 RepID=UPI0021F498B9|nr:peptidase M24 [Microbacterium sp. M28]UYO96555.1 peptidase M24 [Microbacterium sp. M28]